MATGKLNHPASALDLTQRARRACVALGVETVADFLKTARSEFLSVRGCGERTYATIAEQVREWLASNLDDSTDTEQKPAQKATQHAPRPSADNWATVRGRMLAALDETDRAWFCSRIGLGGVSNSGPAADTLPVGSLSAANRDAQVRRMLGTRVPTLSAQLRQETAKLLDSTDGIIRPQDLRTQPLLHAIASGSGDAMLPLRLVSFCWPADFHLVEDGLTSIPPHAYNRLFQDLCALTTPRLLPRPLAEIEQHLQTAHEPVRRGLLTFLLERKCHLRLRQDPERGELLMPRKAAPGARLASLIEEEGHPVSLEDLTFLYRDRFRFASRQRLRSHLRRSRVFLELDDNLWSLRNWHRDELAIAQPVADNVLAQVFQLGGKQSIAALLPDTDPRTRHLVLDIVRNAAEVRYLGRGEVCAATHSRSAVLAQLLQDFRRAAGEVPLSRFVANQPMAKRRLVQQLLNHNRLFVFPAPDRIDVLTNYPFNEGRLRHLKSVVEDYLLAHNGYAALTAVLEEVNAHDLGGGWLHPILLGEILRRHGQFEVLPGGFIARSSLGLGGWVMRCVRNALREAPAPITIHELLVERPELVEFADCLEPLLQKDPLVETANGSHFQLS